MAGSADASHRPPQLVAFVFWLDADTGVTSPPAGASSSALLPRLRAAIVEHLCALGWPGAEPLRWAITAVDPARGLQLEGVALAGAPPAACRL